jgi:uncharacterized protein with GYD domain
MRENQIMPIFVMLTRIAADTLGSPASFADRERAVMERVRTDCPTVEWRSSYAVLGPYDYVDIFTAPDVETATKVSVLVRSLGHAHTELWPAVEWGRFKEIVRGLSHLA